MPLSSGFQSLAVAGERSSRVVLNLNTGRDFGENLAMASPVPRSRIALGLCRGRFRQCGGCAVRARSRGVARRGLSSLPGAPWEGDRSRVCVPFFLSFSLSFPFLFLCVRVVCCKVEFFVEASRAGPRPLCRRVPLRLARPRRRFFPHGGFWHDSCGSVQME